MSWMLPGVRFPSTAWFCVTGWGTGSKLSSPFFSFYFCWKQRRGLGFFVWFFLLFFYNKGSHPLQVWQCLSLLMLEGDPLVAVTWRNPLQGPTQASQRCFILLRELNPLRGSLRALWQEQDVPEGTGTS